jgi:hypothetical protein
MAGAPPAPVRLAGGASPGRLERELAIWLAGAAMRAAGTTGWLAIWLARRGAG